MPGREKPPGRAGHVGGGGDLNSANMRHCSLLRYKQASAPMEVCITLERYSSCEPFTVFLFLIYFFLIYFWLHWVFVAACGLSLVAASGGHSSLQCVGFSSRWLLLLRSMGSRSVGFSSCGMWAQ